MRYVICAARPSNCLVLGMVRTTTNNEFRYYMHYGETAFSFELAGRISDDGARELQQAWLAASSLLGHRSLIVDLSYVTGTDVSGQDLLRRWHDHGAKLVAKTPEATALVRSIIGQAVPELSAPSRYSTWLPFHVLALWVMAFVLLFSSGIADAANLKAETLESWDQYVASASAQMQGRLSPESPFLFADEAPDRGAKLRSGEILVSPAGPHIPVRVPSGLIHDWIGLAFIPNATLHDVLPVVRDYGRYKEFYRPAVIDSKAVATGELEDRFSMLLMNKSVISKTALAGDYQSSYFRVNAQRWYSVATTTRIQEIASYGTGDQHTLPEDEGKGIIWRVYSITRFEERDGGVYVELEAIVLSRDIPVSLRWIVDPIVRRVSRESLLTSLHQTQDAVRSTAKLPDRYAGAGRCSDGTSCGAAAAGVSVIRSFR